MRRISATVLLALTACARGGGPAPAPSPEEPAAGFRYLPATAHYVGVQHRRIEQDFQGQANATDHTTHYRLTVTIAGETEPYDARITLDSLRLTGVQGVSAEEVAAVHGWLYRAQMRSSGQLERFDPGDSSRTLAMQLAGTIQDFFPVVPAGGVGPGATWADTASRTVVSNGLDLQVETISRHASVGWTDFAGGRALEVRTTADYTISGTGRQGGQHLELEGLGNTHATRFLWADGTYAGTVSADTALIDVFLPAVGLTLPVRQYSIDTVTAVR